MTVDTAAMRLVVRTIRHQEHCTSLEADAQELLDSAADELDKRERIIDMLKRRDKELADKGWTTDELVSGNKHHESCPVGAHFARFGGGNE